MRGSYRRGDIEEGHKDWDICFFSWVLESQSQRGGSVLSVSEVGRGGHTQGGRRGGRGHPEEEGDGTGVSGCGWVGSEGGRVTTIGGTGSQTSLGPEEEGGRDSWGLDESGDPSDSSDHVYVFTP